VWQEKLRMLHAAKELHSRQFHLTKSRLYYLKLTVATMKLLKRISNNPDGLGIKLRPPLASSKVVMVWYKW
jgi:hypothetical protein